MARGGDYPERSASRGAGAVLLGRVSASDLLRTLSMKNIFASRGLDEQAVIRKFRMTVADGKNYQTQPSTRNSPS
jgi:hypothetical protein